MSDQLLDRVAIDAAVAGTADSDDPIWADLVGRPDADVLWRDAIAARRALERRALFVVAMPGLADIRAKLRSLSRAEWSVTVQVNPPAFGSMLNSDRGRQVRHGGETVVEARIGDRVAIQTPPGAGWIWRDARGQQGLLGDLDWHVEAGDSPVLLVAVPNSTHAADLDSVMKAGTALAVVIIVERQMER